MPSRSLSHTRLNNPSPSCSRWSQKKSRSPRLAVFAHAGLENDEVARVKGEQRVHLGLSRERICPHFREHGRVVWGLGHCGVQLFPDGRTQFRDLLFSELRHKGRGAKLERIPMELLILLIEKDGSVVSREEILNRFSGKDVFVDESIVKYSGSGQSLTFS